MQNLISIRKMNITRFLNNIYFNSRTKEIDQYAGHAGEIQHRVLMRLIGKAARTEWGHYERQEQVLAR